MPPNMNWGQANAAGASFPKTEEKDAQTEQREMEKPL